MDVKESVQAHFGPAAAAYAVSRVHARGRDLALMLEALPLRGDERVLDVGCGAGHTAVAFSGLVGEVHALDLTQAMLDQTGVLAGERGIENLRLRRGDAEALPYPDDHFDGVTSRLSAHHYPHPELAVSEIARVLRPGGWLLLSDSVSPEDQHQDSFLNSIERLRDPSHVRNHSIAQWCKFLAAAGIEPEVLGRLEFELEFDDWVARIGTPDESAAQIRALFDRADPSLRCAYQLGRLAPYSFVIPIAVLHGRLRAA